ncbi:glutamate ligase [Bifidobacterium vansinderenii]|uniref:Lipid II isoglutaminyl synthase (glutamine-hydrolyzing) subunit MurT n=1 Tax=Bifidobacterium vansinderenii TaxID=1984871 RepID=A0A229VYE7_9BIFI|nr:glutamate ligase [Bifidobacterium vansinderenii]
MKSNGQAGLSANDSGSNGSGSGAGAKGANGTRPAIPRKPWSAFATPLIGKGVRLAARVTHHGGSAFPGKVIEGIDPGFLARTLSRLPYGVVLVSGTNGKTTTTRMVASMFAQLGLKVFTNPTGSNFTRGVVSALLQQVSITGHLNADIAVLELDEAYAVHFVKQVRPRYALLLNVMRDQLDRFGEIDNTARLLGHVAEATDGTVVLNREDPRIAKLASLVPDGTKVHYFGLSDDLRTFFPSDDDMHAADMVSSGSSSSKSESTSTGSPSQGELSGEAGLRGSDAQSSHNPLPADVTLTKVGDHTAEFLIDGTTQSTGVKLEGVYNLYNAAAALAVVRAAMVDATVMESSKLAKPAARRRIQKFANAGTHDLINAVAQVTPAFGRGESIDVNGTSVELLLVKNPMGFRMSLKSFDPAGHDTMIVINDQYADGRDMSWLWDVDFTGLRGTGVRMVSGVRAWDMALRLEYDQVPVGKVEPDIDAAVDAFVKANPGTPKRIYCTYTSMLKVRSHLGHLTKVSDAGVGR